MNKAKFFLLLFFSIFVTSTVKAQNRLHWDIGYHYNLGLAERIKKQSYNRNTYNMGGYSLRVTTRYELNPKCSLGVGLGLDRYTGIEYNTFPIFATVRYSPISITKLYTFTDLGYAIKLSDEFYPGITGKFGIGYTIQLTQHFGLNFQIAYDLKKFGDILYSNYDSNTDQNYLDKTNSIRHSLSFGIGITF